MTQPEHLGRPKKVLIADDLRAKIERGDYPLGSKLPSVAEMSAAYSVAPNTVVSALDDLRKDGLLVSYQGNGTYVQALPAEAKRGKQDTEALQQQMTQLRAEVHGLREQVESAEIKAGLARVESNLRDLFGKLGFDYPREDEAEDEASEAVAHGKRA